MTAETIVLTGGGTGGHVFPMIAVAEELRRLAPHLRIVFVGTERGIESQLVPERGYELETLHVLPLRGVGLKGALRGVSSAARALPEALQLVRRLAPKVVLSLGGYAAGAVSLAARAEGIPLALMEPNSVIGFSNRIVARVVQRAYTVSVEVERHFPPATVLRTGLAIRRGFEPHSFNYEGGMLNVLVLGGSQGAQSLNETLPLSLCRAEAPVRVVHQAGKGKDEAVRALYQQLGATDSVEVVPFIRDVPKALRDAHLVIGRSGAGAVSEICSVGRPSLLIPYPFAAGNHQFFNAQALVRGGAAECIIQAEATAERLTAAIDELTKEPGRLRLMAHRARGLGRPDAAEAVALDLIELGNIDHGEDDSDFEEAGQNGTGAPSDVH